MNTEEEYLRRVEAQKGQQGAIGRPPMTTISSDAEEALELSNRLHDMLNNLEARCFPPEPREVDHRVGKLLEEQEVRRVPIGSVIRETRQRLDSGLMRLEAILQRL